MTATINPEDRGGTGFQTRAVAKRRTLDALTNLRSGFSNSGRRLLQRVLPFFERSHPLPAEPNAKVARDLASALLSGRGEASGIAIATDLLALYEQFDSDERRNFFLVLASEFDPDETDLIACWERYRHEGSAAIPALFKAVEPPRQELFRRLNFAPGGTEALVRMRADLLSVLKKEPALERVDADLKHVLQSWFNRGFLSMQSIDWSSPASLLERLISYEAVHDINSWAELRLRLDPQDRRCFAFFHPVMPEEPLIFVEVGLTAEIPNSIQAILAGDREPIDLKAATTATFYSISNCQPGLAGISFGHFLIKQVAADLKRELPDLECFVTLSPIPGLMSWLRHNSDPTHADLIESLSTPAVFAGLNGPAAREFLLERAVAYFTKARNAAGRPRDPVARFHLGNGARLERLNWAADISPNGLRQSGGLMVNYLYDLARLEENHEAFVARGELVTGLPFQKLASATAAKPNPQG